MSRRRWIADEWSGDRAAITGQNARHLAQVLRAKVGQIFELAHDGELRIGTVDEVSNDRVTFSLGEKVKAATARRETTLVLAIFKFDRFEWAIEKVTELGVARIVPVIAQRTDAHLAKAAGKRTERWRRIAHEASQQSRRVSELEIADPQPLKAAMSAATGQRFLLSENERSRTLSEISIETEVTLAVGPEGGWTEAEEKAFAEAEWQPASLGSTILRAETAAIAAAVLVQSRP